MKALRQGLTLTLALLFALPVRAAPGEIQIPLTGAQMLFQMFRASGSNVPTGLPALDLRNVRRSTPVVSVTMGGEGIRYTDIQEAIEEAIDAAAPNQDQIITLIGSPPHPEEGTDPTWCRLIYGITPDVTFLQMPETLNVVETAPGHLSASFDSVVRVKVAVSANIFNLPISGDNHFSVDLLALIKIHARFNDVSVWPPVPTDLFIGNPPQLNPAHVELTLERVGGNVEIDGLEGPVVLTGFLISSVGVIASPFTMNLTAPLTFLGPIIAAFAPGVEDLAESILNKAISDGIAAGIGMLDTELRGALASAGNVINLANAVSNNVGTIAGTAGAANQMLGQYFPATVAADTRINNDFLLAGVTVKRNPSPNGGSNSIAARIRFPKYKCEYEQGALVDEVTTCMNNMQSTAFFYEMTPKLVPVNAELLGRNCASVFKQDLYSRSYLGSDWVPPNAVPTWQPLPVNVTGGTIHEVTVNGATHYQCDIDFASLPTNIIYDFGAQNGSGLASRIVPVRDGPSLPAGLAVDPAPFLGRVHMFVSVHGQPTQTLNEDGDPVTTRSRFGSVGPQPASLAKDCPPYTLALDGVQGGVCSNNWEPNCPDCY